ncbi:MAG TPA: Ig-like domain-containing protein, partial [Acidothermaceae bacterium]
MRQRMRTTGGGSPGGDAVRGPRRRRRRQRILVVAATTAGMLVFPLRSAVGAVSNTVVLTGGPSGQPNDVRLIAADSAATVFSVTDPELAAGPTTYVQPHNGAARPLPARFTLSGVAAPTLVDDMLGAYEPASASGVGSFIYGTIDGSVSGGAPVTAGEFQGTSADGYLYSAVPDASAGAGGSVHLYDVDVTTKATTDLGAVPGNPAFLTATASAAGVLLETKETGDSSEQPSLDYVRYADPSTFVQLASSVPIQGGPVLGTNSVAWLENATVYDSAQAFDPTATKVLRVTLGGSVVERRAAPNAYEVATTPTYTGVLTASPNEAAASFSTLATHGGQQTAYQLPVGADLLSTDTDFVVTEGGTPGTAGIYTLPSAAGPAVLLHPAGAATLRASTIAVSPARVVWRDNGIGAGLWSRALGTVQTTLAAGDPSIVSSQPDSTSEESVSSSGDRVAFVGSGNTTSTNTTSTLSLVAPGQSPRIIGPAAPDDELTLSGTRLLQRHDDGSAGLIDLVSGATSNLPAPVAPWSGAFLGRTTYQLWGNELAWLASDGSVWFKDLAADTTTEVSGPAVGAGESVVGSVAVAAGIVAWSESICKPTGAAIAGVSTCSGTGLSYRNALTLGQTYTVQSARPTRIQLSNGYIAFDDNSNGSSWVDVAPLYSAIVEHIAALSSGGAGEAEFSISGSMLGWIGADNLPHAAALPHIAAKPWYLGNGVVATSLVTDGTHNWEGDFFTSEGLTQCAVTISTGSTKVRLLPCDTTHMIVGEAVVSWDGKDAVGSTVSPGTYSWTLTGAGVDGPILNADGSDTPISGTISTTPHSIVSLACASSSGAAYHPVTLTASVAGSSPGTIEFFDGATSLGSSPVSGGVATLTTDKLGPGSHSMTATFTAGDRGPPATSAPVALMLSESSSHVGVVVQPSVDPGTLTMTTP